MYFYKYLFVCRYLQMNRYLNTYHVTPANLDLSDTYCFNQFVFNNIVQSGDL